MIKILFVCHGNICRSAMAEFIMKDLLARQGLEDVFYIESAGTSSEELGNPVYPPARRKLAEHGIRCDGHRARKVRREDYDRFDLLIVMDRYNFRNMMRLTGDDPDGKIKMLMDYTKHPGEVDDPWYTGDFETVYHQIVEGCGSMLAKLI